MSSYSEYIESLSLNEKYITEKEEDIGIYADIAKHEKIVDENRDLYEVFRQVNLVLKDSKYQVIQTCSPSMDVNNGNVIITAVSKTDDTGVKETMTDFVNDLKKAVDIKKLVYKVEIDNLILDGLKKYKMLVTVSR